MKITDEMVAAAARAIWESGRSETLWDDLWVPLEPIRERVRERARKIIAAVAPLIAQEAAQEIERLRDQEARLRGTIAHNDAEHDKACDRIEAQAQEIAALREKNERQMRVARTALEGQVFHAAKAKAAETKVEAQAQEIAALRAANERLVHYVKGVIRYGGNSGDDFLANSAREVLGQAAT